MGFAASTYSYVSISTGQNSVETDSVGVSTEAKYYASNSSTSTENLTMEAYACWIGWPYTKEYTSMLCLSDYMSYTEKQSKNSSFYMKLIGNGLCNASGYVEVK